VEIRAPAGRVFRLAWNAGEDGVRLQRPTPFEPGRTVDVRLRVPGDDQGPLVLRAELRADRGEEEALELAFIDPPEAARRALRRYVHLRLELPGGAP
jgi:hypothetical protein